MSTVWVGEHALEIDLFVFDKDGLLFQSQPFWIALANARIRACLEHLPLHLLPGWLNLMGVEHTRGEEFPHARGINPSGVFAVASPREEIIATGAYLVEHLRIPWVEARRRGEIIFETADRTLDLREALHPREGFPDLFSRLRGAGIPYGIATSDTLDRVNRSLELFDDPAALSFAVTPADVARGKPDPEMLYQISQKMGVPLGRIAMVGDSFVDVEMASRAGAIGIGVPETESMKQKIRAYTPYLLASLAEIRPA